MSGLGDGLMFIEGQWYELASYGGAFSDGSRSATIRLIGRNNSGHLHTCQIRQQDGDDETCTCRPNEAPIPEDKK